MAFEYTNKYKLELPLAIFLMHDSYDYDGRPNVLSATKLIKPLRELILTAQNPEKSKTIDVSDLIQLRMGSAIHSACEEAWKNPDNVMKALKLFGASESVMDTIKINPENPMPGDTSVYIEQRVEKEIDDFIITGAYDLILDGEVNDYKSTGTWGFINGSGIDGYIKQGSIYKWLNSDKITSNYVHIHYILTDWTKNGGRKHSQKPHHKEDYPLTKALSRKYPLWSLEETEEWIVNRLKQFKYFLESPQEQLPECTDEELWVSKHDSEYKHYKDSSKTRATNGGVHKTMDGALAHQATQGGIGVIKHFPGPVRRCNYCSVEEICSQAKRLLAEGRLA